MGLKEVFGVNRPLRAGSLIIVGATVVLFLVLSPRVRRLFSNSPEGEGQGAGGIRLPVTAVVVQPQAVEDRIRSTGTVLAEEEVELRSEINGIVERIRFEEGRRVRKGDLLLKINDAELRAQLKKLESQRNLAQDKERRRKQLFDKQNISPEDYEIALNELNAILAEIDLIRARIDKTEIRAPFDGVIGLRSVSVGSYASPATRIATLQNLRTVKVDFSVPEKYAGEVGRGQTIEFSIAGTAGPFRGTVYAIEPKIDPATRTVLLRARAENTEGRIRAGAFAEVTLVLSRIPDALMVPTQAIVPELGGQKVFVVDGGLAAPRRVETGLRTDTHVQITAGLQSLDTVLTSGLLQVAPGTPLTLTRVE